jgi:hypothetical protein
MQWAEAAKEVNLTRYNSIYRLSQMKLFDVMSVLFYREKDDKS